MDAHWVAAMVVLTGANWAVCSAGMMAAKSAVVTVDSKVAMWVVLTVASTVVYSADCWAVESVAVVVPPNESCDCKCLL